MKRILREPDNRTPYEWGVLDGMEVEPPIRSWSDVPEAAADYARGRAEGLKLVGEKCAANQCEVRWTHPQHDCPNNAAGLAGISSLYGERIFLVCEEHLKQLERSPDSKWWILPLRDYAV